MQIDNSVFGISNMFREIAHIYDAMIELRIAPDSIGLPSVNKIVDVLASLFVNGQVIELFDGNNRIMNIELIKLVLKAVHKNINRKKVFVISTLGLQSSGKTALLNTMFGFQNPSRSGRCTRGITAQLIPMSEETCAHEMNFEYVLVIDTEGLRAPEVKESIFKRDNEIATIITGLGDITILNIMGENIIEIRDVLQTVVHAFIRLRQTNSKVDINKCCMFIHQNVLDIPASAELRFGLKSSVEILDTATKEAAESEGIANIKKFNQVIAFDMESDVKYLPNLWHGHPPMARTNPIYSQNVARIRNCLLLKELNDKTKSFKNLKDLGIYMDDLWKGVLSESFVFSFRNSLEKKAYATLEKVLREQFWEIEDSFDEHLSILLMKVYTSCKIEKQLLDEHAKIKTETKSFIEKKQNSAMETLQHFFSTNDFKELTIQWKEKTFIQVKTTLSIIYNKQLPVIDNFFRRRKIELKIEEFENGSQFLKKLINSANDCKRNNICDINKEFESFWTRYAANSLDTNEVYASFDLRRLFDDWLAEEFQEHPVFHCVLEKRNMLETNPQMEKLTGTFSRTNIDIDDFELACANDEFKGTRELDTTQEDLEDIFKIIDTDINNLTRMDNELTYVNIRKFLVRAKKIIETFFKKSGKYVNVKTSFTVKALVHVSNIACYVFQKHNQEYMHSSGIIAKVEQSKRQWKEKFDKYMEDIIMEDEIAALSFKDIVKSFIENAIQLRLPNSIKQRLKPLLPSGKSKLIDELHKWLVNHNNFERFLRYIKSPSTYAQYVLTKQCENMLFHEDNLIFYKAACDELTVFIKDIKQAILLKTELSCNQTAIIDDWITNFTKNIKDCNFTIEYFEKMKSAFQQCTCVNLEKFNAMLLEKTKEVEEELHSKYKSVKKYDAKWRTINPIEELFTELWGCRKECMFCGEPCMYETHKHAEKHRCRQHKPKGLLGKRSAISHEMDLFSCSDDVSTDIECTCVVFQYACTKTKGQSCTKGRHMFKEYTLFFENWDIKPDNNINDYSFWHWFIYKYKDDLKEKYKFDVSHVPQVWSRLSQEIATLA